MNRKSLLFVLLAVGLTSFVAACGGGGKPKQQIILAMTTPPPSATEIKLTSPLSATVTNDASNGGVLWTLACDTGANCGTLTAAGSASGDTIGYTAPSTIPADDIVPGRPDLSGMLVVVTATSATDSTIFAASNMVVVPISDTSFVAGPYAFVVSGSDASDNIYSAAGSVTLDGAGNVMSGEEDYNNAAGLTSTAITVTGGSYTVGQDGQGTITLDLSDVTVGVAGVQTLAVTFTNLNHARVIQFDDTATSSGSLDFQTFTAGDLTQITGGYAFEYNGVDVNPGEGLYVAGGVATADGNGTFTMTLDENVAGNLFLKGAPGSTYSIPDANGRGTFNIGGLSFVYYIVNGECLRIVDVDAAITEAGSFYGQGSSAGSITVASLTGANVFTESGSGSFGFLSTAGLLTADGAGNFSAGFGDANEDNGTPTNGGITGTYSFDVSGDGYGSAALTFTNTPDITSIGVYATDPTLNLADPNNTGTGLGGALIVDLDLDAFATGFVTPQDTTATFFGNYALDFQAPDVADAVGSVFSDGTSTVTGSASVNDLFFSGQSSQATTGTFAADAANPGRSTATIVFGTVSGNLDIAVYQATNGELVFVDIDPTLVADGVVEGQ